MATNQRIKGILEKQLESGRLAHAYLFVGPKATGKKELARELAERVLDLLPQNPHPDPLPRGEGGYMEKLLRHPDYSCLDCAQDASAESVREFIGKVFLSPFVAKRKFALILNIENLNTFGANALLKTLEEPPESTVMVLTADTRRVLPTIVSRCQMFNFNRILTPPAPPYNKGGEEGEVARIIDFTDKPLAERLVAVNQLAGMEEAELKNCIEEFVYAAAVRLSSIPEKYQQLAAGLKAYEDLRTNKNRKLVLQGLMLKI